MEKLIHVFRRVWKDTFSFLFSFSVLLLSLILFQGCQSSDSSETSSTSSTTSDNTTSTDNTTESETSTATLASTVISELSANLSSTSSSRQTRVSSRSTSKTLSNSLTSSQITLVIDAATAAVATASLDSSEDLIQLMPKIIEGSQAKLATVGLSNSAETIKVINVIGNSLIKSINGRSTNLPSTSAESDSTATETVLSKITSTAVANLDEAGLSSADIGNASSELVGTVVGSLGSGGLTSSELAGALDKITAGAVGSLDEITGFSVSSLGDAIDNITSGATSALGDIEVTGYSSDNLTTMVEKVTAGATSALGNITMTGYSSDNLSSMVEKVTSGATSALGNISMTGYDSTKLTSMVEKVTSGATGALGKISMSGYEAADLTGMMEKVTAGATGALGRISMTGYSSDNLSSMVEKVTSGATGALGNISMTGFSSDNLSSMVEKVTAGATGALGKISMTGYDAADLSGMLTKISAGATGALGEIEMDGYDSNDLAGMVEKITSGATGALGQIEMDGYSSDNITSMTSTITTSITDSLGNITMAGFDKDNIPSDITNSVTTGSDAGKLLQPPMLTEITVVSTPTKDNTPSYTFKSSKAGTIYYGGSCSSSTTSATADNNTIVFSPLLDGTYSNCSLYVTSSTGVKGNTLSVTPFTVDTTAPTANVTAATDNVGSVTGVLTSGNTTDDTALALSGTNESGSSVKVFNGSTELGSATVSGTSWSYIATVANGTTYQFNVKETDLAGNTSNATSNFAVTGDTTAPTVSNVAITSATGIQNYLLNAGDVISVTATFNENVTVTGIPQLTIVVGNTNRTATYATGSGSTSLVFQYTIQAGETDANGISILANTFALYSSTIKDAAGNYATLTHSPVSANTGYKVDTTAPTANFTAATDNVGKVTGALTSGNTTDDTALALSGTNESGSSVKVYNVSTELGAATVSGTSWSYSATVANGTTYQFNVKETDLAGNTSNATSNFAVIGDTTAPTANFSSATDNVGTVTGVLTSGNTTDDTALALSGTNESGSSVKVYNVSTELGAATVSGTSWSYSATVANGTTYQLNVKETDLAGNTSAATSNFAVTGDTAAPTASWSSATDDVGTVTGVLTSGNTTDDTALALSGTNESGSSVKVFNGSTELGSATVSGTSWSYSATVANGTTYQFNVNESDIAGNTSAATSNFAVTGDTSAPTANFSAATDNVGTITGALTSGSTTDDTELDLSGTNESGSSVKVFNGSTELGSATVSGTSWSYSATVANSTTYQFNVRETDLAGNSSNATSNFAVTGDTTAPTLAQVTAVTTPTNNTTPGYVFYSNEAGTISYGGSCSSGTTSSSIGTNSISFGTLSDANYSNCTITVTDSAGNASSAFSVNTFEVDTTAPSLSQATAVTTPTNNTTPGYAFSSNEAGTISYGGSCSSGTTSASSGTNSILFNVLSEGTYDNCIIIVTDSLGNASSALSVNTFVVDTTAPTLSQVTAVTTPTNDTTPGYAFSSNEAGTISYGGCSAGGTSASNGTNSISFGTLSEASYSNCTITVTDSAGNASSALSVNTFVVDTTAPNLSELTAVTSRSIDTTPSYEFSSDDSGTISYGGSCSSSTTSASSGNNSITFNPLAEDTYSNCKISVTDNVNNTSDLLTVSSFTIVGLAHVGSGWAHSCAADNGTVKCWGTNWQGRVTGDGVTTNQIHSTPVTVPGISNATEVGIGMTSSCALLSNGTIKCWGQGDSGQLGNGSTINNPNSPVTVSGINNAISVSNGRMHACALLSTGSIKCWGKAENGQLGNGSTTGNSSQNNQTIPVDVSGISNAINISAGYQESCAVLDTGSVKCWGAGFGTTPVNISSNIQNAIQVSTWYNQAVVLDNGSIKFRDENGTIETILEISNAIQVSNDYSTRCAVLDNASVYCQTTGQYSTDGSLVSNINNAKQVSTFEGHSCAALSDGTVKCWGAGGYGQLGNGATNNQNVPVSVSGIE